MSALFVAGAGTDIGKTYVAELVIRHARRNAGAVRALKPVASGVPKEIDDPQFLGSDTARLLRAQQLPIDQAAVAACSPWRYLAPLSPDMAAAAEGEALELSELVRWVRDRLATPGVLTLVEGAGGVMSPICADATNLDLICALGCPTLLVSGSYLGAISHCLTALEALKAHEAPLAGLVVNESANSSVDLAATVSAIQRFAPAAPIAVLRRGARDVPAALAAMAAAD
jgi:dethiobiotin synthetase